MPLRHIPSSVGDRLRSQDRMIRQILRLYPRPPRIIDDRWYPARNGLYLFLFVCALAITGSLYFIIPYILTSIQIHVFWQTPRAIGAVFLMPFSLITLWYIVIHPLYDWQVGLQWGRPAIAIVSFIKERPAPNSVRGTWEIWIDARRFTTNFGQYALEGDTWVQHLREGDRIQVLLHPTKDKVLLAYGP